MLKVQYALSRYQNGTKNTDRTYCARLSNTGWRITVSRMSRVIVAQTHRPGASRSNRLLKNLKPDAPSAELAMTKPEMTKNISTPTQPKFKA